MLKTHPIALWQRALILLSGTVVGLVAMLALWWGRPVLIPVALAILLTFLLNPVVRRLQRLGVGRVLAVLIAVTVAGTGVMGVSWMVTRQVASLLAELPQNSANLAAKAKELRKLASSPFISRFEQMFEEINQELQPFSGPVDAPSEDAQSQNEASTAPPHGPLIVRSESALWLQMTSYLSSALEVFVTLAFALVLLVFFLLGRDDLRDRAVLLAGKAHLALTSKALEEVTDRISRYIGMVAIVNGGFGVALTVGLLVLQVPYALLWGFLAAGLRFIPYIGPWVGAIFPIAMSLAVSEGWWQPLAVFAFVLALELISNNVVEPLAFGRSTGVSPIALLISAAFWLYLWGPIGLVLSAPIAVCLVVLGKHVPQLRFLSLILGDTPALRADASLYQRLMLGDQPEAAKQVMERLKTSHPTEVYDEMLIPALNYAKRDVQREHLTDDDRQVVAEGVLKTLRQSEELLQKAAEAANSSNGEASGTPADIASRTQKPVKILGCPAMDESDSIALEMLRQILNPKHWDLELTAVATLTSELVDRLMADPPEIVCIASLPPRGLAHARYLCKRLRDVSPDIQIIVGRWGQKRDNQPEQERLLQAGAGCISTTLSDTVRFLDSRLPLLTRETLSSSVAAR